MANFVEGHLIRKNNKIKIEKELVEDFAGAFEIAKMNKTKFEIVHSKLQTGKGVTTENID